MRTFKCMVLSAGHVCVYGSITMLPDIQQYFKNPIADIMLSSLLATVLVIIVSYIVLMPLTKILKCNGVLAYAVCSIAVVCYTIMLALLFVCLAPVIPMRILHEMNVICGNVGMAFTVLVVYDNMKGAHIRDTYNELLHELEDIERNDETSCGVEDKAVSSW